MKLSETILHPTFECDEENIVWLSDEIEKLEDEMDTQRTLRHMNAAKILSREAIIEQLQKMIQELENILWKCRHGGKGGIPVDYQEEVDRLLADYQK